MPPHGASGALRFGRLFAGPGVPKGDPGEAALAALARVLTTTTARSEGNVGLPAGYTYFGQFVDHDLTFDASPLFIDDPRAVDPEDLANRRTPRLDLDSVYGAGPLEQPYLYDFGDQARAEGSAGAKLLVGGGPGLWSAPPPDLPRNEQHVALIGDPRNDDNKIVAQVHLLFLRFHNLVVDRLRRTQFSGDLLTEARRIVLRHYQRAVFDDFLPRILGRTMFDTLTQEKRGRLRMPADGAMPVEFSAAAYRFGHSLVRDDYTLNDTTSGIKVFSGSKGEPDLRGGQPLKREHAIDWKRFFGHDTATEEVLQPAMRIDHLLSPVMRRVPHAQGSLAELNLRRGVQAGLPDGRWVAEQVGAAAVHEVKRLLAPVKAVDKAHRADFERGMPLWFYVVREAFIETKVGAHLGETGGRIVGETLLDILRRAPEPVTGPWTSELWDACDTWSMFLTQAYVACEGDWARFPHRTK